MEYQEIKDWLDRLILLNGAAKGYEDLTTSIQAIMSRVGIQLYKGIEIVADVMGLQLDSRKRSDGEIEYFFIYSGVEFFQLGRSDEVDKM